MIGFFRRIRKKLADDNKPMKYMRYAVGEIALVVIGILIALSINNWNTYRIERNEEAQILKNLKVDFQHAIEQFTYLNAIRSDFLQATVEILKISNEEEPYDSNKLDSLIVFTLYSPTFNDPIGSLRALVSSDRIDLIRNNPLKVQLMSWSSESGDMTEGEIVENNITNNQYYPILYEYISLANALEYFKIHDINFNKEKGLKGVIPSKFIKNNYLQLLKDAKFINTLHMRTTFINISKHETTLLIDKAEKIIKLIEEQHPNKVNE